MSVDNNTNKPPSLKLIVGGKEGEATDFVEKMSNSFQRELPEGFAPKDKETLREVFKAALDSIPLDKRDEDACYTAACALIKFFGPSDKDACELFVNWSSQEKTWDTITGTLTNDIPGINRLFQLTSEKAEYNHALYDDIYHYNGKDGKILQGGGWLEDKLVHKLALLKRIPALTTQWDKIEQLIRDNNLSVLVRLKNAMSKVVLPYVENDLAEQARKLAEMNAKHAWIWSIGSRPMITSKVYNDTFKREIVEFVPPDAFEKNYSNRFVEVGGRKGSVPLGKWWTAHPNRKDLDTVIFAPGQPQEYMNCYNLWEGFSIEPKKGSWRYTKRHIYWVLCNGNKALFKYVMRWLGYLVQHPDKLPEVAVVFKGEKGTGKSVIFKQFVEIFGRHAMTIGNAERLVGKFSGHFKLVCFLFCEEAYWPGLVSAEPRLKQIITQDKIDLEEKFKEAALTTNRLHIAMCTNNEWIIPASKDERRFLVNEVDSKWAEKGRMTPKERKAYFNRLFQEIDNDEGRSAMLYDLLRVDLTGFHPRYDIPETEELNRQKQQTLSRHKYRPVVLEFAASGIFPGLYITKEGVTISSQNKGEHSKAFSGIDVDREGNYTVTAKEFENYIMKLPSTRGLHWSQIALEFKKVGFVAEHTRKCNIWIAPSLKTLRHTINQAYGITYDWDELDIWDLDASAF